jgi:catechol 2,3-dioxygenase-like lactoylglutathione lyase family enzyme
VSHAQQPAIARPAAGGGPLGLRYADHVALRVGDYNESLAFYTGKLGFELVQEWTLGDAVPGVRFAYLRLAGFEIELIGDGGPRLAADQADIGDHLSRGGYIHCACAFATWTRRLKSCGTAA